MFLYTLQVIDIGRPSVRAIHNLKATSGSWDYCAAEALNFAQECLWQLLHSQHVNTTTG